MDKATDTSLSVTVSDVNASLFDITTLLRAALDAADALNCNDALRMEDNLASPESRTASLLWMADEKVRAACAR